MFVYIMMLAVASWSVSPMMHELAHHQSGSTVKCQHDINRLSLSQCNISVEDNKNNAHFNEHTEEQNHCSREYGYHIHTPENNHENNGCCSSDGACHGQCHCPFSIVSLFNIASSPRSIITSTEIELKTIFKSHYSFNMPEMIWHPPKKA